MRQMPICLCSHVTRSAPKGAPGSSPKATEAAVSRRVGRKGGWEGGFNLQSRQTRQLGSCLFLGAVTLGKILGLPEPCLCICKALVM